MGSASREAAPDTHGSRYDGRYQYFETFGDNIGGTDDFRYLHVVGVTAVALIAYTLLAIVLGRVKV